MVKKFILFALDRLHFCAKKKAAKKKGENSCLFKIKSSFKTIKEEMNGHREAINQNTNEIQSNYEYMCRLDSRLEKLSERIDELTMIIQKISGIETHNENSYTVSALTSKEQEVFLAIYVLEDKATYKNIARRTGLTENLVVCYATNLMTKGVPITKSYINNEIVIGINKDFRKIQTKHNILKINENITKAVMAH